MVGELEVVSSGVDVDRVAEDGGGHGWALDVPTCHKKATMNNNQLDSGDNFMRQKFREKFDLAEFLQTLTETFLHVFRLSISFFCSWEEA